MQFVLAFDNLCVIKSLRCGRMVGSRGSGEGYLSLLGGTRFFTGGSILDLHEGRDWKIIKNNLDVF